MSDDDDFLFLIHCLFSSRFSYISILCRLNTAFICKNYTILSASVQEFSLLK